MYRYLGLLIVPFIFTIIMETSLNIFNDKVKKINLIIKKDPIFINVHKDFEVVKNLDNILNFNEKINTISELKINFLSTAISDKIYNEKIYNEYDSVKINEIYSEKFIEKDSFANPRLFINLKQESFKKSLDEITTYSFQLASSDWKKMFSSKKIEFIDTVLPLISFENQKILLERKRLIEIKNYLQLEKTLVENDIIYMNQIAKKYKINIKNKHKIDLINELLFSVDVIPNSIVLAQAANESGWGTSRFAREYNALFGQYTYDENSGIVPFEREEGKKHLIRNFSSFNKSVESYFKNINTHYAYQRFREVRSQIDKADLNKSIKLLTQTLDMYAEDDLYVDTINSIIDSNKFHQFDLKIQAFIDS